MKVLLINKYLYARGGDAISTLATGRLLESHGHEVMYWGMEHPENPAYPHHELFMRYVDLNAPASMKNRLRIASNLLYSFEAKNKIERLLSYGKPDVVHLNNFAHQISPSILSVFRKYKIPTVMTLHDYKMVCASYLMVNSGRICEACKNSRYYMCLAKKCVKDSLSKSLLNTIEMYLHHRIFHIYGLVDQFIAPSIFLKNKLREMGFDRDIVHLPNFVDDNGVLPPVKTDTNKVLYFGRLSFEKGVSTLLNAVKGLDLELNIIGTGAYEGDLRAYAANEQLKNVFFLGYLTGRKLLDKIRNALIVVIPSQWYENNPRTVLEAFIMGTPVIGAEIGGIPELVLNNETGLTFESGNARALNRALKYCIDNKREVWAMGARAQQYVRRNFNAQRFYEQLMEVYDRVLG